MHQNKNMSIIIFAIIIILIILAVAWIYYKYFTVDYLKPYVLINNAILPEKQKGPTFKTSNLSECAKACTNDLTCKIFEYNSESQQCGLNAAPVASGILTSLKLSDGQTFARWQDVDMSYFNVDDQTTGGSLEECEQTCAGDLSCPLINYQDSTKTCWIRKPKGGSNAQIIGLKY